MCGGNSRLPLREKQVSLWGMGVPGTTTGLFLTLYQNGEDIDSGAGKEQRLGLPLALHCQSRIRVSVPGTPVLSYFCVSNTPVLCPLCVPLCDQAFSQVSRCMGRDGLCGHPAFLSSCWAGPQGKSTAEDEVPGFSRVGHRTLICTSLT